MLDLGKTIKTLAKDGFDSLLTIANTNTFVLQNLRKTPNSFTPDTQQKLITEFKEAERYIQAAYINYMNVVTLLNKQPNTKDDK